MPRLGTRPALCGTKARYIPFPRQAPCSRLDPDATYFSRDMPFEVGDLAVLYTDGLSEARSGGQLFGEDRVAHIIRRDPGQDTDVICKTLLEAGARLFLRLWSMTLP